VTEYVKSTNFASKDALATGNPLKIVKGTEIDTEFNNIATAVATKADIVSPTFTGTPTAPTASAGTNSTQLATTAFVQQELTAHTVSTDQIEDGAVTTVKIANSNVTTAKIADSNVTTAKIADSNVTTVKIADLNVTAAKIANGGVGTTQLADSGVTPAKLSQPFTRGTAVASTSGTSIEFTGIPSWARRITVCLDTVSVNANTDLVLQLGTSSAFESTGYAYANNGNSGTANATYFGLTVNNDSTANNTGVYTIVNITGNTWIITGAIGNPSVPTVFVLSGKKSLSAALTRLRVTTVSGTAAFDNGSINIFYE